MDNLYNGLYCFHTFIVNLQFFRIGPSVSYDSCGVLCEYHYIFKIHVFLFCWIMHNIGFFLWVIEQNILLVSYTHVHVFFFIISMIKIHYFRLAYYIHHITLAKIIIWFQFFLQRKTSIKSLCVFCVNICPIFYIQGNIYSFLLLLFYIYLLV